MNEYKKRIIKARKAFSKLNKQQERELLEIYEEAARKLVDEICSLPDCRSRNFKIDSLNIINNYKVDLYTNLNTTINNSINKSSNIQRDTQLSFIDIIAPNEYVSEALKINITKVSSDVVRNLIRGDYYKDGKTLSKRLWNITSKNAKDIDILIKVNISKGANVRELARDLNKYINPKNFIQPKTLKVGMDKSISYQAQRLARTSITHAATQTQIQSAKSNPFSKGLKWNLSASHSSRMNGKMDICDDYSGRVFKAGEVPLQHCNCLCYFTEEIEDIDKIKQELKEWTEGKRNSKLDKWIGSI